LTLFTCTPCLSSITSFLPLYIANNDQTSRCFVFPLHESITCLDFYYIDHASHSFCLEGIQFEFSKYEGLGNDFILIDDRDKVAPSLTPEESEKLCHRNFGIGGDGVIFALKPPSDDYDFTMRIYNSDGSEPEMCGNGIRCFAQFLKDIGADGKIGLISKQETTY
jgi:hypothetical protein